MMWSVKRTSVAYNKEVSAVFRFLSYLATWLIPVLFSGSSLVDGFSKNCNKGNKKRSSSCW